MLTAYINYPNAHVTIHAALDCANIQQQDKQDQRVIRLSTETLSPELARFEAKEYRFGSDQSTNDMWLYVDFSDAQFERAVVEHIRRILAQYYSPFARVRIDEHCRER
jgi:hypothetical protein